jgi:two-component system sensor kinase FixL
MLEHRFFNKLLGLYISRAILRSFGGELVFEPRTEGCCFAVRLSRLIDRQESTDE